MKNYYKITAAVVNKTKNGYDIFKLQLNNSVWASKLAPLKSRDQKYCHLYKIFKEYGSLQSMIGKYVVVNLNESQYGLELGTIYSYDMVYDFKNMLDKYKKKPFSTNLPIYTFLKSHNYTIESDGSIRLKKPYDFYYLIERNGITICSKKINKKNLLTLQNLSIIFQQFYEGKYIETNDDDYDCVYSCSHTAIITECKRYHKTKGKTLSTSKGIILEIGDPLNEEQIEFLRNHQLENTEII